MDTEYYSINNIYDIEQMKQWYYEFSHQRVFTYTTYINGVPQENKVSDQLKRKPIEYKEIPSSLSPGKPSEKRRPITIRDLL